MRTIKGVMSYIESVNVILENKGSALRYRLGLRNGYKCIDKCALIPDMRGDYYLQIIECVRSGLTTGEAYDIVYSLHNLLSEL